MRKIRRTSKTSKTEKPKKPKRDWFAGRPLTPSEKLYRPPSER